AAATLLAACGGGNTSSSQRSSTSGGVCTAQKKNPNSQLTISTFFPTQSLDPATEPRGIAGGTEVAAIYDTLMRYSTNTGTYYPFVAQSLTPNADSTLWTLKLRPDIKFGDGDPLTAADVEFSMNRIKRSFTAAAAFAAPITSMDVVDDLTIRFHLSF